MFGKKAPAAKIRVIVLIIFMIFTCLHYFHCFELTNPVTSPSATSRTVMRAPRSHSRRTLVALSLLAAPATLLPRLTGDDDDEGEGAPPLAPLVAGGATKPTPEPAPALAYVRCRHDRGACARPLAPRPGGQRRGQQRVPPQHFGAALGYVLAPLPMAQALPQGGSSAKWLVGSS